MATDRPRYTVSVDDEMFQQIENFRFERRYNTRSEATVELIRLGLETLNQPETKEPMEIVKQLEEDPLISMRKKIDADPSNKWRK